MMKHQQTWLDTFLSLSWYEVALRFLFTFAAKTSEVLLTAGLVVSTTSFLTDGSILASHPGVSTAWAWAQAPAIDSSLGVSLSYTFQCLKQGAWIRGALYGLLTLLLAGVAGAITTIDIVSHALHLSMNDAMTQMAINVTILSRLRAVAVIGFILMSRLRDLPMTAPLAETEPEPSVAPPGGSSQGPQVQAAIQSLCAQFGAEEMAQILNACIATKKLVLARIAPKEIAEPPQPYLDRERQAPQAPEDASEPGGSGATRGEPGLLADPPEPPGVPAPVSWTEPSRRTPAATEPPVAEEHRFRKDSEPSSQVLQVPEPITGDPSRGSVLAQGTAREPEAASPQERLEQVYQALVVEGKKPSGRALAERAHVHRSTCVQWLRARQQPGENEPVSGQPERGDASILAEPPETAMMERSEMDKNQDRAAYDG